MSASISVLQANFLKWVGLRPIQLTFEVLKNLVQLSQTKAIYQSACLENLSSFSKPWKDLMAQWEPFVIEDILLWIFYFRAIVASLSPNRSAVSVWFPVLTVHVRILGKIFVFDESLNQKSEIEQNRNLNFKFFRFGQFHNSRHPKRKIQIFKVIDETFKRSFLCHC